MGVYSGPKISNNGLIFHYDMSNLQKSWKGSPTTNLKSNSNFSSGITSYGAYVSSNPTVVSITDFPENNGNPKLVLQCTSASAPGGGGNSGGMTFSNPSLTVGLSYTISFWARIINYSSATNTFSNQNGSGDDSNFSFSKTITNTWTKYSYTTSSLNLYKNTWYVWTNLNSAIWQYANFQIEQNTFATPYVNGARNNTQSILDLTNNHTITANNLVYSSNGSFDFNGTSSNIVVPNSSLLKNNNVTIELIMKNNGTMSGDIVQFGVGSGTYAQYYFRALGGNTFWDWFPTGVSNYGEVSVANSSFGTGVWKHVVIIGTSSGSVKMFINGVSVGSPTLNATTSVGSWTPANLTIGGYSWDGFTTLSIASVKIYNRELSSQEIELNFEAIRGIYGI